MYGWIWHHLPGPTAVRLLCAGLLLAAVVAVLFLWVFPALAPHLPWQDNTVG
jgi:high-affinity Fe2+/Pb2+ permease